MQSPASDALVRKPIPHFNAIPCQGHPEALFDHGAKGCASLGGKFLGSDREVIGNVNRCLHAMGARLSKYCHDMLVPADSKWAKPPTSALVLTDR